MVALTFPDGARREFPNGVSGIQVAEAISKSLAKKAAAMAVDGRLMDLTDPIEHGADEIQGFLAGLIGSVVTGG